MNSLTPLELLDIIEREHNFESPSLRLALTRAKKEHELLKLYRKHINNLCKQEREGVKNSLFSSEVVAYELYEQIKQKEKELVDVEVGEVFYTTFLEGNPIYITGRGLVYTSDKVMEIGDWIVDELSGKTYEIVAIEQRRVMMSPSKVVPPFGYVLRLCYISIMEELNSEK